MYRMGRQWLHDGSNYAMAATVANGRRLRGGNGGLERVLALRMMGPFSAL
jgi:hypothetical protein